MKPRKNMLLIAAGAMALAVAAPAFGASGKPQHAPAAAAKTSSVATLTPGARAAVMDQNGSDQSDIYGMGVGSQWVPDQNATAQSLVGADLVNTRHELVGEIDDVIHRNGHTELIASVGAFLGMGTHTVALDESHTHIYRRRDDQFDYRISTPLTDAQLKALPEFAASNG